MSSSPQFEVLDLRHFSAAQLRPLLMDQAARWQRLLNWDYSTSTNLLLELKAACFRVLRPCSAGALSATRFQ